MRPQCATSCNDREGGVFFRLRRLPGRACTLCLTSACAIFPRLSFIPASCRPLTRITSQRSTKAYSVEAEISDNNIAQRSNATTYTCVGVDSWPATTKHHEDTWTIFQHHTQCTPYDMVRRDTPIYGHFGEGAYCQHLGRDTCHGFRWFAKATPPDDVRGFVTRSSHKQPRE